MPDSVWYGVTSPRMPRESVSALWYEPPVPISAVAREHHTAASASSAGSLRASAMRSSPTAAPAQPKLTDAVGGDGYDVANTAPPREKDCSVVSSSAVASALSGAASDAAAASSRAFAS